MPRRYAGLRGTYALLRISRSIIDIIIDNTRRNYTMFIFLGMRIIGLLIASVWLRRGEGGRLELGDARETARVQISAANLRYHFMQGGNSKLLPLRVNEAYRFTPLPRSVGGFRVKIYHPSDNTAQATGTIRAGRLLSSDIFKFLSRNVRAEGVSNTDKVKTSEGAFSNSSFVPLYDRGNLWKRGTSQSTDKQKEGKIIECSRSIEAETCLLHANRISMALSYPGKYLIQRS